MRSGPWFLTNAATRLEACSARAMSASSLEWQAATLSSDFSSLNDLLEPGHEPAASRRRTAALVLCVARHADLLGQGLPCSVTASRIALLRQIAHA